MEVGQDIETELAWQQVLRAVKPVFGEIEDSRDLIFLIGVQELGMGFRKFSKDEKINVMHVGLCSILSRFGYYEFAGRDKDGWPHWNMVEELPRMTEKENEHLLKQALVEYFKETNVI